MADDAVRQRGAGEPDQLDRLWTPYRMPYIRGDDRPSSTGSEECPFCHIPSLGDEEGLVVHRGETSYVVLGEDGKPLEGEAFYQKVGRADLVEAYQGGMRTKTVIGLAGGATLLAGGIVLYSGVSQGREDCGEGGEDGRGLHVDVCERVWGS